jgi:hypothetical protein
MAWARRWAEASHWPPAGRGCARSLLLRRLGLAPALHWGGLCSGQHGRSFGTWPAHAGHCLGWGVTGVRGGGRAHCSFERLPGHTDPLNAGAQSSHELHQGVLLPSRCLGRSPGAGSPPGPPEFEFGGVETFLQSPSRFLQRREPEASSSDLSVDLLLIINQVLMSALLMGPCFTVSTAIRFPGNLFEGSMGREVTATLRDDCLFVKAVLALGFFLWGVEGKKAWSKC